MNVRRIGAPAVALLILGAGQALTLEAPATEEPATQSAAVEALARKSGCFECHAIDKKVVGPAYQDVAESYRGDARARDALIETIKNGGKGNWTEVTRGVPMPPHSGRLSTAEITRLVDWVLSLQDSE